MLLKVKYKPKRFCREFYFLKRTVAGMGWATQRGPRHKLVATPHMLELAAWVQSSAYPLRNLISPRCAERAKPGAGKPVLIMHYAY